MLRLSPSARIAALLVCLAAFPGVRPAGAQPTNVEILQDLAEDCLAAAPDTAAAFLLDAPDGAPYLRTALVNRWQRDGRTLYLPEATARPDLLRLTYAVEDIDVAYAREGRRRVRRAVTLALHYTLAAPDGRIVAEDRCRDAFTDTLDRGDLAAVESAAFPEATAEPPPAGWVRRYVEPAVLTAAVAVGTYLFFTLRSQAADE